VEGIAIKIGANCQRDKQSFRSFHLLRQAVTVIAMRMSLDQAMNAPSCPAYANAKALKSRAFTGIGTNCDGYAIDVDGWTLEDSDSLERLYDTREPLPPRSYAQHL
jgi:hypothetical protein